MYVCDLLGSSLIGNETWYQLLISSELFLIINDFSKSFYEPHRPWLTPSIACHGHSISNKVYLKWTYNHMLPCTRISLLQNPNSSWSHGLCQTPFAMNIMFSFNSSSWLKDFLIRNSFLIKSICPGQELETSRTIKWT